MNNSDIKNYNNKDNLINILKESESIMISIVIISKAMINNNANNNANKNLDHILNSESYDNVGILNITHTDAYTQDIKNRFESLYALLDAKYIFPLSIWKNNIAETKISTGNINRYIDIEMNKMDKFKVNIMLDNIKQNIPRFNYIILSSILEFFENKFNELKMCKLYYSIWIKHIGTYKFYKFIENKCKIKNIIWIEDINQGLNKNQIKYYRQYGIKEKNNKQNNRKRKLE